MSEIHCPNCHKPNAPNSKFCNHCGVQLLSDDTIICAKCQTPNSNELFYCDNCGARLQASFETPSDQIESDELEAPSSLHSPKMFSLPAREPGQTGELDPNTLPDWLRTGKTKEEEPPPIPSDMDDLLDNEDLPSLADLLPSRKEGTGDLPEWLVSPHSNTEDPIFQPPDDITTEAYLEMLEDQSDQPEIKNDILSSEGDTSDANLPDWLADVMPGNDKPTPPKPSAYKPIPASEVGPTEWLKELGGKETSEFADSLIPKQPATSGSTQADNTSKEEDTKQDEGEEELGDWLAELGSAATSELTTESEDWFSELDNQASSKSSEKSEPQTAESLFDDLFEDSSQVSEEDFPDWLAEVGPLDTQVFSMEEEKKEAKTSSNEPLWSDEPDTPQEEAADWLSELGQLDTNLLGDDVRRGAESDSPTAVTNDDNWFQDFAEQEANTTTETPAAESATDQADASDISTDELSLTGLLSDFVEDAPTNSGSIEELLDEAPDEADALSFTGLFGEPPEETTEAATLATDDDMPSWLDDNISDSGLDEIAPSGFTGLLDDSDVTADAEETAVVNEDIPDWLRDLEPASMTDTTTGDSPKALTDIVNATDDTTAAKSATDDDLLDFLSDDANDADTAIPDWLANDSNRDDPLKAVSSDEPAPNDDLFDFLETGLLDETNEQDEAIPDWLADMSMGEANLRDPLDDLFADEANQEATSHQDATANLDWLMADMAEEGKTAVDSSATNDLIDSDMSLDDSDPAIDPLFIDDSPLSADLPDWLSEFDATDLFADPNEDTSTPEASTPEASTPEASTPTEATITATEADPTDWLADLAEEPDLFAEPTPPIDATASVDDPLLPLPDEDIDSAPNIDDFFDEPLAIPDWLADLGTPDSGETGTLPSIAADEPDNLIENEALPAWISDLRPGFDSSDTGSPLPGLATPQDSLLPDALQDIPAELAGAELPDWLQDVDIVPADDDEDATSDTFTSPMPDWLHSEEGTSQAASTADILGDAGDSQSSDEWTDILRDLPPARDPLKELAKTSLPDWVNALKPKESNEAAELAAAPAEVAGPLSGIRGVIPIAPTMTAPQMTAIPINEFAVTKEQEQQAKLLRQITHHTPIRQVTLTQVQRPTLSIIMRSVLALALLAAIIFGVIGPSLIQVPSASPHVSAVEAEISAAIDSPVLVVFDYTPAMAAELTPQATLLLNQLIANNNTIITASQSPAGLALADITTSQLVHQPLGLVPGGAIGLRQLKDCLATERICNTLFGRNITIDLHEIALVIVLTDDKDNLISWIEQVGTNPNVGLVAGVTQSIGPIVMSYYDAAQLNGVIQGIPETAEYERLTNARNETTNQRLNALTIAQLLISIILLIYFIFGLWQNQKGAQ